MSAERVSTGLAPLLSIGALVRELLREPEPERFGSILAQYTFPSHDLLPYLRWNMRHYTRTCVARNDRFELLVVCFEADQRTSIHDYDSEVAWIQPLMGEVIEERFSRAHDGSLLLDGTSRLMTGRMGALTREDSIHRFTAQGTGRSITLNLYAPPMSQWRVYDEGTGAVRMQEAGPPR
ncbi:MAG: cysteine dioxygenase family protein [Flavobacteriales bacterium]|nr:cysteine dioxygenase family protein [Flavobacteriales bacterium]